MSPITASSVQCSLFQMICTVSWTIEIFDLGVSEITLLRITAIGIRPPDLYQQPITTQDMTRLITIWYYFNQYSVLQTALWFSSCHWWWNNTRKRFDKKYGVKLVQTWKCKPCPSPLHLMIPVLCLCAPNICHKFLENNPTKPKTSYPKLSSQKWTRRDAAGVDDSEYLKLNLSKGLYLFAFAARLP